VAQAIRYLSSTSDCCAPVLLLRNLGPDMQLIDNIPVWGAPDEGAIRQIKTCAKTADKVALMADHHKGYAVPIGGVVAYKDAISPSGVGFDIACGNKAVLLLNTTPLRMIQFDPGRARTRRWVRCGLNATK